MDYMFGTMIEIPRAAWSPTNWPSTRSSSRFGTNDLTQMTFGFSRDDAGKFLMPYIEKKILPADPFETHRPGGRGQADADGGGEGQAGAHGHQAGHLRRAWRRTGEREVLPSGSA